MDWPGNGTIIATCGGGAESALATELSSLGLTIGEIGNGIVHVRGGADELITANLRSRIASRVLLPLVSGTVGNYDELYRLARRVPWQSLVPPTLTIAVSAVARDQRLSDSRLAALKIKDAVVDSQRGAGARSSVDRRSPEVPITLFVENGTATVSLDSSGAPLHVRGYRQEAGEAPLRETVAASMLVASGWDPATPLCDPFCGSGTIAIEAAMMSRGIAPGAIRDGWAMAKWPWFPGARLAAARAALARATPAHAAEPPARIVARDTDPAVIEIARRNARRAGVEESIEFVRADALEAHAPWAAGTVVTNPPYGERMELPEARDFYARLGSRFKESYDGWDVWILSANREAMKGFGLRAASRMQLWNGGLDARLYHYEIYRKRRA
jgi:putative N6-adenine-specific DNA methylase